MARTVNQQEYAEKRREILDAAQRLVLSKGYERMTIGDILAELKISSGAFYHYFASKPAVLEALIEHIQRQAEQPLYPLLRDPNLAALEKLKRYFAWFDQTWTAYQDNIVDLLRVWYTDDNAVVRQKVEEATDLRRTALLNEIVCQGIKEGSFVTAYPGEAGEVVVAMIHAMSRVHARLLLSIAPGQAGAGSGERAVESAASRVIATHSAFIESIERILGISSHALSRLDRQTVTKWINAMQARHEA